MEYVAACDRLLPEIERLGKLTGNNSSKQMSFFEYDADPDAENNLALAIQTALLNDCPNTSQEAELAVAWGDSPTPTPYRQPPTPCPLPPAPCP